MDETIAEIPVAGPPSPGMNQLREAFAKKTPHEAEEPARHDQKSEESK
ncbi:hypothetical protein [Methylocapsa palsarum]|nr:hypothetical protein [Methylocapsa palsarum]